MFIELLARYAGHEVVWPPELEQVNIAAPVDSMRGDTRGLIGPLSGSVTTAAPTHPTAAQIAARPLPRPLSKIRSASSKPRSPADPLSSSRPPPGLSR